MQSGKGGMIIMEETCERSKLDVLIFILITYGYFWLIAATKWIFDIPFTYDPRQLAGKLVLAAVPAALIGAIATTLSTSGRVGLGELLTRAFRWRFSPIWYAAAFLIPFAVVAVSTGVAVLEGGAEISDRWFAPIFPLAFLAFFLFHNGIGEEVGWRGFALPRLQQKFGSLGGSIIVGILWALWHTPLFLMPGTSQYGSSLLSYVWLLVCWSVIMTMLVNKAGGSVLVAIIFHETCNFIAFTITRI